METNPTKVDKTPEMEAKLEELSGVVATTAKLMLKQLGAVLHADDGEHQVALMILALPMVRVEGMQSADGTQGYAALGTLLLSNIPPHLDFHNAIGVMLEEAEQGVARAKKEATN